MTGRFVTMMDLRAVGDDTFVGPPSPDGGRRTYGGQLLAQTLGAAGRTVPDDRAVHSIHSYFLKAGNAAEPVEFAVDRVRDGRSFSQRQVIARQGEAEVFRCLLSFHVPEDGLEWEEPITIDVAPPTGDQPYTDYGDFIDSLSPAGEPTWPGRGRPMDVRYVNPPTTLDGRPVTEAQRKWMRIDDRLGDDRGLHDAGLAYLADSGMNAAILLPHGRDWQDDRLTEASLDHTMWFHRPAHADEWLWYDQRAESTSGGRGLASGRFYDLDGRLIATCVQEGLMRWSG